MEAFSALFFVNFFAVAMMMTLVWIVSLWLKNAGIIDIFWGVGFVLVAWVTFFAADGYIGRKLLIVMMTTVWGLRLATHLFLRNSGQPEDHRYVAIRKRMGHEFWWKSLIYIFGLQSVLLCLISISIQAGQASPIPDHIGFSDFLGIVFWGFGIVIESVADFQLTRFKADTQNRGKVMDRGLWRYSRHPNYFGESLVWWGIWCTAWAVPYGILTIISPVLITFLLLRVSGVRLMERNIGERRPEYRDYIRRTSAFIPWFPKGT